jgi:hypothetical protein
LQRKKIPPKNSKKMCYFFIITPVPLKSVADLAISTLMYGTRTLTCNLLCMYEKNPIANFMTNTVSWVVRWNIFGPKIPIWVYFRGPWNGNCWYVYGHLVYVVYGRLVKMYGRLV